MLTRKLFRTVRKYKSQFISMVIMIAIGVGVFLGFHIEWKSLEEDAFGFLADTHYADYRLYSENGFGEEDRRAIAAIDGVEASVGFFSVNVEIKNSGKSVTLNVGENDSVSSVLVTEGADYDASSDGIWLSARFAEVNGIEIGDEMTFRYRGLEISDKVVGLIQSGENMICVADENQLMPDFESHGFAYLSPAKWEKALGTSFYPQINLISDLDKEVLEERVKEAVGTTLLVTSKNEHAVYAGVNSEIEEGKTMGSVLPVLFLAIAILTMTTTMHRIAANEKVQIGTLKALGFRDGKILFHYTLYGFLVGIFGIGAGIGLGFLIAAVIISPSGMMGTYLDMPVWKLCMPAFCIPVMIAALAFLTLISFLSVKKMLQGTASEALRPYTPKNAKQSLLEKLPFLKRRSFGTKWNLRDVMRHKARSAMTLVGVFGCTILLVGGFGMKDTMEEFLNTIDREISNYETKVILTESATREEAERLAEELNGDRQASVGISYEGKTVTLDVVRADRQKIRYLNEKNERTLLSDDGVYLCLRLKDGTEVGDMIEFSPYGSENTYSVRVAGYLRSPVSENMVMTEAYADRIGISYHIGSIYTDIPSEQIETSTILAGKQDKQTIMDSYDTFMELMNLMVVILALAAIVLGIVVLYNLGAMSHAERQRELATLKILGFDDRSLRKLLIGQNVWLTVIGLLLGLPGGYGTLWVLVTLLASEYELNITVGIGSYLFSTVLTFAVSLLVGLAVSRKNRRLDMVEALKGAE